MLSGRAAHLNRQPCCGSPIGGHAHEREFHVAHIGPPSDVRVAYSDGHHLRGSHKAFNQTHPTHYLLASMLISTLISISITVLIWMWILLLTFIQRQAEL